MSRLVSLAKDPYVPTGVVHMALSTIWFTWNIDKTVRNEFKLENYVGVVWRDGVLDQHAGEYSYAPKPTPTKSNCFPVVEDSSVPDGHFRVHGHDGSTFIAKM